MTLVELLIVITVMTILIGVALPVMKTSLESSRLREATRQVNTQFAVAKSIAVENGRGAGVWLDVEALPDDPTIHYASRLFLAEVAAPYAGDVVGATVRVDANPVKTDSVYAYYHVALEPSGDSGSIFSLVAPDDAIRFEYKGAYYIIDRPDATDPTTIRVPSPPAPASPPWIRVKARLNYDPAPPAGLVRYQVLRKPQKSSSTALELPKGTVIDLTNSGFGLTGRGFGSASASICVLFAPGGSVARLMVDGQFVAPTQTMHMLVGSIEKLAEPGVFGTSANTNLEDHTNLWVSIAHQTGRVTTSDNGWFQEATFDASLARAREFAQSSQAKGGR